MKDWEEIERLFHLAITKSSAERESFLRQQCGEDQELLNSVRVLLRRHEEADFFLEKAAIDWMSDSLPKFGSQASSGRPSSANSPFTEDELGSSDVDPKLNQTVSHYRITQKLGQGGMGEVFLAEDTQLGRRVALKFLPDSLKEDDTARRRFLREARSAAALDHPYICHINEIARTDDGQDFIVMEYVEGQSLKEKLSLASLPLAESLQIACELGDALGEAHQKGIIHRDIKPANIMLTSGGHAKVMDFGLAKKVVRDEDSLYDPSSGLTREGITLGTLAYMSPEQLMAQSVDQRSDIFSFGVVLYEMLTGVHPFRRGSAVETGSAILNDNPPPLPVTIPGDLHSVVKKMLEKNPENRFQSIHEVLEVLENLSGTEAGPKRSVSGLWIRITAGTVLCVIAALVIWKLIPFESLSPGDNQRLIAVLPFQNLSPSREEEWFSDGMTEEIIGALSKISSLSVISRTSVMQYKDGEKSVKEIAQELGVDALLEGSARQSEGRVRITAQLIDARSDQPLWADTYDRDLTGIFEIQEDVARQIVAALETELSGQESERIGTPPTENLSAYRLYLQGSHLRYHDNDPRNLDEATLYLEEAIRLDPQYTLAYALLAQVHFLKEYWIPYWQSPAEFRGRSLEAAETAIELDESLPEVHVSMGVLKEFYSGDWSGAGESFRRAIELNPGYWSAHWEYGLLLSRTGEHELALREFVTAHRLDPVSIQSNAWLASAYVRVGDMERAREAATNLSVLQPNNGIGFVLLAHLLILEGKYEEARKELVIAQQRSEGWRYFTELGYLEAVTGNRSEALRCADEITQLLGETRLARLLIAKIYLGLGESDAVFESLDKSGLALVDLNIDPRWDSIRSDPRFLDLLRRMNLPEG